MKLLSRPLLCLVVCALVGCATTKGPSAPEPGEGGPASIAHLLPPSGTVAGWKMDGGVRQYPGRKLFDFIDGAGEIHLTYGFVTAATADYVDASEQFTTVSVFQVATAADAYGLNSYYSPARGKAADIGQDSKLLLGTCRFWKGPYYVVVEGEPSEELDPVAQAFARAVAERIPEEGEAPGLVALLPGEGRKTDPVVFLHKPLILSGLNFRGVAVEPRALGLNEHTSMAVAEYAGGFALSVTRYPDEESMQPARQAYANADIYVDSVGPYLVATTASSERASRAFRAAIALVRAEASR